MAGIKIIKQTIKPMIEITSVAAAEISFTFFAFWLYSNLIILTICSLAVFINSELIANPIIKIKIIHST